MSMRSNRFLGFRNFFTYHRGRLSLKGMARAVWGIGLSMVPLLVVLEVSSGMIEGITRRYVEVGSFHYQIRRYAGGSEGTDEEALIASLTSHPEILTVTPFVEGQGLIYSEEGRTGIQIRGMSPSDFYADQRLQQYVRFVSGDFSFGSDLRGVVISQVMARKLGVSTGDQVKLLVSRPSARGGKPVLRPGTYRVTGIFSTGYQELDALSVYLHKDRAEQLFQEQASLVLGVKVSDYTERVEERKIQIRRALPQDLYVLSWYDLNRSLYQNLGSTKTMLLFIMALIIIVAAVNIYSTILSLVTERQEQIAVLKSLGARPSDLTAQFVFTGFFLGLFGVILGMVLGLLISVNINQFIDLLEGAVNSVHRFSRHIFPFIEGSGELRLLNPEYYLEEIPIKIPLGETFLIGFLTLSLCTLAAWFPSKKAGNINPLEVMGKH
jgi:lipoprotein-releasing system permease protein